MFFLHLQSQCPPVEAKTFQNKTWEGLDKGDSRLLAVMSRRWEGGTSNCHKTSMMGAVGRVMLLIFGQWQGFSSVAGGNMAAVNQCRQPIPGQPIDIPMYLVWSYSTGTKFMFALSFQYSILNRSYQKMETKCMFYQSKYGRLIFVVLYKA